MAENGYGKARNNKGKNGNGYGTEEIHGRPVKIGTGTGKRVAKKARGAISERRRRMMEELED